MECPGCNYVDPLYDHKTETYSTNEAFGPFWKADIKLTRSAKDWNEDSPEMVDVAGCPRCKKLFVDD